MTPPHPAVRPMLHARWPEFCEAVKGQGFNRKLLASDQEWVNHCGAMLFGLFLDGVSRGARGGSRLKRLATMAKCQVTLRNNRRQLGRCPECGGECATGLKKCRRHLEQGNAAARVRYRRRFG